MDLYYLLDLSLNPKLVFDDSQYNGSILFEPIKRINESYYICNKKFHLDNILNMYNTDISFGIVLISGSKSICYKLIKSCSASKTTGRDHIDINNINEINVKLQKRQKKGGQSAQRIGRLRDEKENIYIQKILSMISKSYIKNNNTECDIKGIVLAGPAELKHKVKSSDIFKKYFDKLLLKVVNTSNIDNNTVYKVYDMCVEEFATKEELKTVKLINKIKELIRNSPNKLVFGYQEVIDGLDTSMLKSILIESSMKKSEKDEIYKLNLYGCDIKEAKHSLGINFIGIKWF